MTAPILLDHAGEPTPHYQGNRSVNISRLTIGFGSFFIIGGLISAIATNMEKTAENDRRITENAHRIDRVEAAQAAAPSKGQVDLIAEDVRFLVRRELDRGNKK